CLGGGVVERFHDKDAADTAERNFDQVFKRHELPDEIPEKTIVVENETIWLPKLLLEAELVQSTSEGRRMIKQNAVSVNGEKNVDIDAEIRAKGEVLLKLGKRRFCKVLFS
ncbi:MAG: tyrosine--tRNA ligase, partial [Candidatus Electrothrix sp. AR4]|nr:tyrosine--tRNA ligase [Candidatus Electrothrix sp. AR4]